ncbi:MAG TPA: HD-GYP domain-containing protein [Sediminispirochaeta sp.]|nr:HD-GYP domain-containing protein [Sediminispirochaeta sp.]
MRNIKVSELTAGLKFSKPVYIEGENLLVPENVEIKQKDIDRLKRWGVEYVQSEGTQVSLENAADARSDLPVGETLFEYKQAVEQADQIFIDLYSGRLPDKEIINDTVENVFQLLIAQPEQLIGPMFSIQKTKHHLSQSAVNCLVLSVMIGRGLKLPSYQLINLATAAVLHDSGMSRIPQAILDKKGALSEKERQLVNTHTIHSYRIISRELGYPEEVGRTALYHHERWDGKGYPKQLKGKEIPLTARILSVVDAYEAMVRDRPYRDSMIGYRAMRQLLNDNSRRFDSEILKVFLKSMGIYPVGSIVILNDGSVARVVGNHEGVPLRPKVKLLVNNSGRTLGPELQRIIDLYKEAKYFIVRAVSVGEIKKMSKVAS